MDSLFVAKEYRLFLKNWVEQQTSSRGLLTKMANHLNCQNSHLSRVLKQEVHLTPDQAFAACEFMNFSDIETNYFLKLVEFERSGNPNFRKRLKLEMSEIKSSHENLAKRFQEDSVDNSEKEMLYYSAWFWSAIHVMTDIPKYQTARAIADRLKLSEVFVRNCLQTLLRYQLVKQKGDLWQINTGSIHLPKTSPMNAVQHNNWRQQAVQKSQDQNGLHYTIVQTISVEDIEKVKQVLFKTIDQYKKIADASPSEELICFTCDFFTV
jgi:uncharacterized protein (TIGR02147 family)